MTYGKTPEPSPGATPPGSMPAAASSAGTGRSTQSGSPLLRYLLVFGVGALIGLVLFGWILFPVRWTQTLPSDLRGDAQEDYLRMVADTYAANGDLPTAIKRLEYWTPETSAELYERLAQKVAAQGDTATADRLRAAAEDTNLIRLHDGTLPPPTGTVTPAPESGQLTRRASSLNLFLYLFAALIILGLLVVVARSLRVPLRAPLLASRQRQPQSRPSNSSAAGRPRTSAPPAAPVPNSAQVADRYSVTPTPAPGVRPAPSVAAPGATATTPPPLPAAPVDDDQGKSATPPPAFRPAPSRPAPFASPSQGGARGLDAVEVFRFTGDPNYNEVREIAHREEYLGEYGMGAGFGGQDHPDATYTMEVWLFDKSDIRTVTAVLLPPEVYNDKELRSQAAGNATAVLLANGATVQLQTNQLLVEGRIRKVAFGRPDGEGTPINQLEVEMSGRPR